LAAGKSSIFPSGLTRRLRRTGIPELGVKPGEGNDQADRQRLGAKQDVPRIQSNENRRGYHDQHKHGDNKMNAQVASGTLATHVDRLSFGATQSTDDAGGDKSAKGGLTQRQGQTKSSGKPFRCNSSLTARWRLKKAPDCFDCPAFFDVTHVP